MKVSQRIFPALGLTIALSALAGCSSMKTKGKHELQNSSALPAASGKVEAKEGKNGNTELSVKVEHLARPSALQNPANTYVVWVEDRQSGNLANLGALKVDDNLNGRLDAVTPFKDFDVFLTPEAQPAIAQPSGERVLWTQVAED